MEENSSEALNGKPNLCTGPLCGRKKESERNTVTTPGTYCRACYEYVSAQARKRLAGID